MNYFVNENIFTLNSGTEFSAVKRLLLFKKNKIPVKILTRNYNKQLYADLKSIGISHRDIINLYDYFQEVSNAPEIDLDVRYTEVIDKRLYHIEGQNPNESLLTYRGKTVGKVNIAPGTVGLVGDIEYYNDNQAILVRDNYDRRGFKSSTIYYHSDGTEGMQLFFDLNGKPKIEVTHMYINGQLRPTMWKLLDYKGKVFRFDTENEFFVFFMSELAKLEASVFINDRPTLTASVAAIEGASGKWQYLHGVHSSNNNQAGASRQIVDYLKPIFQEYKDSFDGILTATEQEVEEIRKVFDFKNVLVVPDTYAESRKPNFNFSKRNQNQILYLGRLSPDKKPVDPVTILAKVHEVLPKTKLLFCGYSSSDEVRKQIDEQIEKLNLKDFVEYKNYQTGKNIQEIIEKSALLINTAESETFGMNILEAMNVGVPVVAYNVKYGPKILIDDGVNGHLIPYGAVDKAAQAIVDIIGNPENWERYARAAYDKSQCFNAKASWQQWKEANKQVKNLFLE